MHVVRTILLGLAVWTLVALAVGLVVGRAIALGRQPQQ